MAAWKPPHFERKNEYGMQRLYFLGPAQRRTKDIIESRNLYKLQQVLDRKADGTKNRRACTLCGRNT